MALELYNHWADNAQDGENVDAEADVDITFRNSVDYSLGADISKFEGRCSHQFVS